MGLNIEGYSRMASSDDCNLEEIKLKIHEKPSIVHESSLWRRAFFQWSFPLIQVSVLAICNFINPFLLIVGKRKAIVC
jgi:hypothetical protein